MSVYFSRKYDKLTPYTPGEQPIGRKFIKLNTNESPFPPSPAAQEYACRAAGNLHLYSDPECRELRSAAAKSFGLSEDELIFTNGSDEVLNFAFMAFCDDEHPAVFPNITYGFYPVFANVNSVPFREIPLSADFSINVDDYIGAKGTIFIANPNAPTGIALPLSDIERIIASNPDGVVVIDEAYVDFGAESALPLIRKYPNLLVCRTFSKSRSLAGGRLGFGAACPDLIRDLNTIRYSTNPYNVNRITMAAGIGSLEDAEYFEENRRSIIEVREETVKELRALGFEMTNSLTNFLFIRHPKIGGDELRAKLREAGILVRHFNTDLLRDYLRVTIGSAEEMKAFSEAAADILRKI